MEGAFGFPLEAADWRGNAAAGGGGSLWDVGVYPLNAARFLLAEDPVAVEDARAVCDAAGLERSIAWTSVFASGARAACTSSYDTKIPDTMRILGEGGSLMMAPAFSHRERYALRGQLNDGTVVDERTPTSEPSEFRMEAEALARSVLHGEPLLTPGEDGLADMVAMEAIYAAAGVPFPPRGV
jgi:predicted dehydrogenase